MSSFWQSFSLSPTLALVTFSVLPLMILATNLFARRAKIAFRETRARLAQVIGNLAENLSGIRVIQAFAQEDMSVERFDEINAANRDATCAIIKEYLKPVGEYGSVS